MAAASALSVPVSTSSAPVSLTTCSNEWRYLSEGKLNVVFTHAPPAQQQHLTHMSGHVLKVSKGVLRCALDPSATPALLCARLEHALLYARDLLAPLLRAGADTGTVSSSTGEQRVSGAEVSAWADLGRIVWLDKDTVRAMFEAALPARPSKRVLEYSLFDSARCPSPLIPMLLLEDYTSPLHLHLTRIAKHGAPRIITPSCSRPTVCMELKPKWGFLPPTSTSDLKLHTCRFCMHQHTKVYLGEVSSLSGFCPLDLYSCSRPRVHRALTQLLRTPQNNLRIFVRTGAPHDHPTSTEGGVVQLLDVHNSKQLDLLLSLMFPPTPVAAAPTHTAGLQLLLDLLTSFLCDTPQPRALLHCLHRLQSQLDCLDIEGVAPLYEQVVERAPQLLQDDALWRWADGKDATRPWLQSLLSTLHSTSPPSTSAVAEPVPVTATSSVFDFPIPKRHTEVSDTTDSIPVCARWRLDGVTGGWPRPPSVAPLPFSPCTDPASCETSRVMSSASSAAGAAPPLGCLCVALHSVRAFLLAATFKDVSLMCTLQRAEDSATAAADATPSAHSSPRTRLLYAVRLVDLESKSAAKMREYLRLDREIVVRYQQVVRDGLAGSEEESVTAANTR